MNFDPCDRPMKICESIGTPTPKVGAHLGMWGFISSHSLAFPVSLLAYTFVSLCLGCEPKAKVTTTIFSFFCNLLFITNKYNEKLCVHYHYFLCLFDY